MLFPWIFFCHSSETDYNFLKITIFTIMSTSVSVGSYTDPVLSIHIRLAILTDISWNKFKNHMVSTWKPHGVHMETTWYLHKNHMVSTWKPCGNHIVSI